MPAYPAHAGTAGIRLLTRLISTAGAKGPVLTAGTSSFVQGRLLAQHYPRRMRRYSQVLTRR